MSKASDIRVKIGADLTQFKSKMKAVERRLQKTIRNLENSGRNMFNAITMPVVAFGAVSIKAAADIDKLKKGLQGIMQDAASASDEFTKLVKLAKNPGLNLKSAVKGSVKLQSIGYEASEARYQLTALANAVALVGGTGEDLDGVTTAIQQIISKGKVHAEEINQMAERLPQVRLAMIDAFGTANTEVLQEMNISAKSFVDTIIEGLSDLDRAPNNLANSLSNLTDTFKLITADIGVKLFPMFNRLMGVVLKIVTGFTNLDRGTQRNIINFGALAVAIGPAKIAIAGFLKVVKKLVAVFRGGLTINPLMIAAVAIAAAAIYVYKNWEQVRQKIVQVTNAYITLYNESLNFRTAIESTGRMFKDIWATVKLLIKGFGGLNIAIYKTLANPLTAKHNWAELYNDLGKMGKDYTEELQANLDKAVDNINNKKMIPITEDDVDMAVKPLVDKFKELQKMYRDFMSGGIGGGSLDNSRHVKSSRLRGSNLVSIKSNSVNNIPELPKQTLELKFGWTSFWAEFEQGMLKVLDLASSALSQLSNITDKFFSNKTTKIENSYAAEARLINNSLLAEVDKAKLLDELETQKEDKLRAVRIKEAKASKRIAVFQSIINGFNAVSSALATGGPIYAGIVGALATAQTGMIIAQPIPALAKGGAAFGTTTAIIGDNPNARIDPEVVAPFSKVVGMFDNQYKKMDNSSNRQQKRLHAALSVSGDQLQVLVKDEEIRKSRRYGKAV